MSPLYAAHRWVQGRRRAAHAGSEQPAVGLTPARVYPSRAWIPPHTHASPTRCTAARTARRLRLRLRRASLCLPPRAAARRAADAAGGAAGSSSSSSRSWSSPRSPQWPSRPCVRSAAARAPRRACPRRTQAPSDRRLRHPHAQADPIADAHRPAEPAPATVTAGGDVIGGFGVSGVVDSMGSDLFNEHRAATSRRATSASSTSSHRSPTAATRRAGRTSSSRATRRWRPAMGKSGINVVTMANNHAGDMGDSGLLDSITLLREARHRRGRRRQGPQARPGRRRCSRPRTARRSPSWASPTCCRWATPRPPRAPASSPGRADLSAVKKAIRAAGEEGRLRRRRLALELRVQARARLARVAARARPPSTPAPTSSSPTTRTCSTACSRTTAGSSVYSLGNLVFSGFSGETAETVLVPAHGLDGRHRRAAHPRGGERLGRTDRRQGSPG